MNLTTNLIVHGDRHQFARIIIKALELSTLAPVEANKQLIRFVRTAILKDPKATDERARTYIEAAYQE